MKNLTHKQISHRTLRQGLEERYAKLTETEYGGNRYIDEVNFLETVLADEVEQSESPSEKKERIKVEASLQKLARPDCVSPAVPSQQRGYCTVKRIRQSTDIHYKRCAAF